MNWIPLLNITFIISLLVFFGILISKTKGGKTR